MRKQIVLSLSPELAKYDIGLIPTIQIWAEDILGNFEGQVSFGVSPNPYKYYSKFIWANL